jgi:hypothetical protein
MTLSSEWRHRSIKNIVANPEQKISDFPWLTETKQRASELSELTDAEAGSALPEDPISRPITSPNYMDRNSVKSKGRNPA